MGSRSHRDGLANSLFPVAIISVSPRYAIGPIEFAWPTLCLAYYQNRSHRVWVIGQTEFWIYPNPSTSVPPSWSSRSHRKSLTVTRFTFSARPSFLIRSHRDWKTVSNGWILCGGYIYPSTSSSFVREPSEQTYTSNLLFLRENHLLMCWGQDIPFLPYESWSLAFPKLLSTQIFFPPNPNPVRESWVLGRLSFEAQEQGVHHQHTICYFLESGVS